MSRTIEVDATAVKDHADNAGAYALLPAGNYEFTVKATEEGPAAKQGLNAAKRILNVQLRITDDSATGKGRVFFLRVPLFQKWAPSQKSPQGATAHLHFQFYEALGFKVDAGVLPDDKELLGKRLAGKLVQKPADEYKDEAFNEVSSVWASKVTSTPSAVQAIAGDVWATSAPAAPTADVWAPAPADVAYAENSALSAAAASGTGAF